MNGEAWFQVGRELLGESQSLRTHFLTLVLHLKTSETDADGFKSEVYDDHANAASNVVSVALRKPKF